MNQPNHVVDNARIIDRICDDFERNWKSDLPERYRELLDQVTDCSGDALLRNLIAVDLDFRFRDPSGFSENEYIERFGAYRKIAMQAVQDHLQQLGNADTPQSNDVAKATGPLHQGIKNILPLPHDMGDYTLLEQIGSGGFGTVYRAVEKSADRDVAIKIPHRHNFDHKLFVKEARAAGRVHHANICQLYHVGTHADLPFLVYRLIPGVTLAESLAAQSLPIAEAIEIVLQLCDGLAAAHSAGILHRDIKPANVLMDNLQKPMITDFGLAKLLDGNASTLSIDRQIVGTLDYMPPEQLDESQPTPVGDVYSLGILLYECLTGTRPFVGSTQQIVIARLLQGKPTKPSALNEKISPRLEAVCLKAIDRQPARRYQSMVEFRNAIEGAVQEERPRSKPPLSVFLAAIAASIVLLAGMFYRIQTDRGELIIKTEDAAIKVVVKQDGESVAIIDTNTKSSVHLKSGEYELSLQGNDTHVTMSQDKVVMSRGKKQTVSISFLRPSSREAENPRDNATNSARQPMKPIPTRPAEFVLANPEATQGGSFWGSSRHNGDEGAYVSQRIHTDIGFLATELEWGGRFWTHIEGSIASTKVKYWELMIRRFVSKDVSAGKTLYRVEIPPELVQMDIVGTVQGNKAVANVDCRLRTKLAEPIDMDSGYYWLTIHAVLDEPEGGWNWGPSSADSMPCVQTNLDMGNATQKPSRVFAIYGRRKPHPNHASSVLEQGLSNKKFLATPSESFSKFSYEAATMRRDLVRASRQEKDPKLARSLLEKIASFTWPIDTLQRDQIPESALDAAGGGDATNAAKEIVAIFGQANWKRWGAVGGIAFSQRLGVVIAGDDSGCITQFDPDTGAVLYSITAHRNAIGSLALSSDEKLICTGGNDDRVKVWDATTLELIQEYEGHSAHISEVAFSSDSTTVVSVSSDKTIRFWNLDYPHGAKTIETDSPIWSLSFNRAKPFFATCSDGGRVTIWNSDTLDRVREIAVGEDAVHSVNYSLDGSQLAVANLDGTVATFDVDSNYDTVFSVKAGNPPAHEVVCAQDQEAIAYGSRYDFVILDAINGQMLSKQNSDGNIRTFISTPTDWLAAWDNHWIAKVSHRGVTQNQDVSMISNFALSLDGTKMAMVGIDRPDIEIQSLIGPKSPPKSIPRGHWEDTVRFVADESEFITAGGKWVPKHWSLKAGFLSSKYSKHKQWIECLDVTTDGNRFCTGSFDSTARIYQLNERDPIVEFDGHTGGIDCVRFDTFGNRVVTASRDHDIRIWDTSSGECLLCISGSNWRIRAAAFRPQSDEVVATDDWNMAIYSASTGKRRLTLKGHRYAVQDLDVSADGNLIASAGNDGTVKIWNAITGSLVNSIRLSQGNAQIQKVRFTAEGRHLVTLNGDGTSYVLRL